MIRPTAALRTGYAEKVESRPLVALPDNFRDADTTTAHGEITDSVLVIHGKLADDEIQRLHAESGAPFDPQNVIDAPQGKILGRLDYFTKGAAVSFMDMTSDNLELVLKEMPSVRVISQSQSQNPVRLIEPFMPSIKGDASFRERLAAELGTKDSSVGGVLSALTTHTETSLRSDEDFKEAQQRYDGLSHQAYQRGTVSLIAAGNQGDLGREFEKLGAETSPSAFRSFLVNDDVVVVGAATAEGTVSSLNSPNSRIDIYSLGENVPFQADGQTAAANGTSVATPLAAGRAAEIVKTHPEFSAFQVKNELMNRDGYEAGHGQTVPIDSGRSLKGDGIIDPWMQETLGTGLVSGVDSGDVAQFVNSPNNVLFGIPGEKEGAFQVVSARNEGSGRTLKIDSFIGQDRHVLEAHYENGTLVPESVTEAFYHTRG